MDASIDRKDQAMLLERFNAAARSEIEKALRPCLDIQRWINEIIQARPFLSRDAVLSCAQGAASDFTDGEVEAALAHHPRIGEQASGASTEASLSRAEQAGLADSQADAALTAGNRAYEQKFQRVFLIRAAGRSTPEILNALHERLGHTRDQEQPIVSQQLCEIALLRLEGVVDA